MKGAVIAASLVAVIATLTSCSKPEDSLDSKTDSGQDPTSTVAKASSGPATNPL